jgi:hypothetical protein
MGNGKRHNARHPLGINERMALTLAEICSIVGCDPLLVVAEQYGERRGRRRIQKPPDIYSRRLNLAAMRMELSPIRYDRDSKKFHFTPYAPINKPLSCLPKPQLLAAPKGRGARGAGGATKPRKLPLSLGTQ